ncbi:MAG: hypothetical protein CVU99_06720 [Firmicutes bacterium HGW-Firmicutes-4]|nr:MAG: hypothetical protein CVU99_06720 [Firmicutes bacterium HGW-Firmicutes-4]
MPGHLEPIEIFGGYALGIYGNDFCFNTLSQGIFVFGHHFGLLKRQFPYRPGDWYEPFSSLLLFLLAIIKTSWLMYLCYINYAVYTILEIGKVINADNKDLPLSRLHLILYKKKTYLLIEPATEKVTGYFIVCFFEEKILVITHN